MKKLIIQTQWIKTMIASILQKYFYSRVENRFRYVFPLLLIGILMVFLFHLASVSFAQDAEPSTATFDPSRREQSRIEVLSNAFRGTIRVYPNGRTPTKSPDEHPVLRSSGTSRDQLWVAGGNSQSWAHFRFWQGIEFQGRGIDPLVQAGADRTVTRYTFPCSYELGAGVVAWGLTPVGSSACEHITVESSNWRSQTRNLNANKSNSQQLVDNNDLVTDRIIISRLEELALIYVYYSDGGVVVDVLVGSVQITEPNGSTNSVDAGNRYLHSPEGGSTEHLNLNEIVNSPSIQTFLDEVNWSSDAVLLLNELKSALSITPRNPQLSEPQQEILDVHNQLRTEVNVPPLSWSEELANYAQEWANELSQRGDRELAHSSGNDRSGAGENIAAGSSIDQMLNLWAEEKENYNASTNTCRQDEVCGHYTQMVWRNTTEIGCGIAPHRIYGNVMVCNYRPPGNYVGQRPY